MGLWSYIKVKRLRKAAEQGAADAQHTLGRRYAEGQGVPQDDREAVTWYRRAAEQGMAPAQSDLGLAHQVLGDVYGWFTEGFDTADLQDAKVLLDKLA